MGIYREDKRHIWACCRNVACLFCACDKPKSGLAEALAIAYNSGMYLLSLLRKRSCLPFLYVL